MSVIEQQHQDAVNRAKDLRAQIASKERELKQQEELIAALAPVLPKPEGPKEAKK